MPRTPKTKPAIDPRDAARALGRLGGLANTPAQRAYRQSPKPWAGRPKGSKNRPKNPA